MTRINTNTAALNAFRNLSISNGKLSTSLKRLSSGFQINRAVDNPAGLVVSEFLRRDIAGLKQAVSNTTRAVNMLATSEAALSEINSLLITVRDKAVESANTAAVSSQEIDANQQQVDSALASIDRIAQTTSFGTLKLLNGNLDFRTQIRGTGVAATDRIEVNQAITDLANDNTTQKSISLLTTANTAQRATGGGANGSIFLANAAADTTVRITGPEGSETFFFANGTTTTQMKDALAAKVDKLGLIQVTAVGTLGAGAGIQGFATRDFGSDKLLTVEFISGTAASVSAGTSLGTDIAGTLAGRGATGSGLTLSVADGSFDVKVFLNAPEVAGNGSADGAITFAERRLGAVNLTAAANQFQYTNRTGAKFQIGKDGNSANQITLGIHSVDSTNLGQGVLTGEQTNLGMIRSGGQFDLRTNPERAIRIIDQAITDVATTRGRFGALERNTFQSNINSLNVAVENLQDAESIIRNTDFASESSQLTRAQILVSAGTSVLATANATPQNVLALLG